jgi:uncharacterized protein (TIGR02001 family)
MSFEWRDENERRSLARAASGRAAAYAVVVAASLVAMRPAHGQASASVALVSEYSVRGVSLSQGRPEPQLRAEYDDVSGWYGGAFASKVSFADSPTNAQVIAYGGYARRLPSGLSWETGATYTAFHNASQYNYHEFYAGVALDHVGGRLYVSPSYYGGGKTAYAELNGSYPLDNRFTLLGHAGFLRAFGGRVEEARNQLDVRLALGVELEDCNVQVAVLGRTPGGRGDARGLAVSATYAFW